MLPFGTCGSELVTVPEIVTDCPYVIGSEGERLIETFTGSRSTAWRLTSMSLVPSL